MEYQPMCRQTLSIEILSLIRNNKLLEQVVRTIGPRKNAARNVMQKNVSNPNHKENCRNTCFSNFAL
jgi:hypothetical protein